MDGNSQIPDRLNNEINIIGTLRRIRKDVKTIYVTTFISLLIALFYSLQQEVIYKTNALIQVGYFENLDNTSSQIEKTSEIVNLLNLKKDTDFFDSYIDITFEETNDNIVIITTESPSVDKNLLAINKSIDFLTSRHNLTHSNNNQKQLREENKNINYLIDEVEYTQKLIDSIQDEPESLGTQIALKINLFQLNQEIQQRYNSIEMLENRNFINTTLLSKPKVSSYKADFKVNFLFAFITGLFFGVMLIYAKELIKQVSDS